MRFFVRDFPLTRRLATLIACIIATLSATPLYAQYRIQPGDTIRLSVPSAPELTSDVMVELDGALRLPGIGELMAHGLTLAELHERAGQLIEARPYRRFGADGEPVFIQLIGEDIQVNIATYRPVFVSGHVASPGPVPYRPGLTVRAAIASAGGARRAIAEVDRPRPQDEARLLGERAIKANEIAELLMTEWRLEAELAANPDALLPDRAGIPVNDNKFKELSETHLRLLNNSLKTLTEQQIFLGRAETQLDARLAILQKQAETQRTAVEFDETEVDRVSSLLDRGIVPINRLIDIRRAQLASATRLLQTEDGVARVTFERTKVLHDREILESERLGGIFEQLRDVRRRLSDARVANATIAEQLAALYGWPSPYFELSAEILRSEGNNIEPATMESVLQPGDVLTVSVLLLIEKIPHVEPRP